MRVSSEAFQKQFAGVKAIKWEKEGAGYEDVFEQDSTQMSAVFSAAGKLEETEAVIAKEALPARAVAYINTYYKREKMKVEKITKANGVVMYEAEINHIVEHICYGVVEFEIGGLNIFVPDNFVFSHWTRLQYKSEAVKTCSCSQYELPAFRYNRYSCNENRYP